mmetsp:Transcript_16493/g.32810  ORF Transcript_16493/g.32810 Transcript_16493/m.32810 type:complete len:499 (+) Transcript_16493:86-1582(+)
MGSQATSFDHSANRGRGYKLTNNTTSGNSSSNNEKESSAHPPTTAATGSPVNNVSSTADNTNVVQNSHDNNRSKTSSPIPPATATSTATTAATTPTININNLSPSIPSLSSSRNALGVTPGWGIGLAHSGTYLSTSVRTSSTIPLLNEDPFTYNAIKSILYKQKLVEITVAKEAQRARLAREREVKSSQRELEKKKRKKKLLEERRQEKERMASQLEEDQVRLQKLMDEREELEKSIMAEWKAKIESYKVESLKKQQEEIKKLEEKHEKEVEQLTEEARVENEKDDAKLKQFIEGMNNNGNGNHQKNDETPKEQSDPSENKEKKKRNFSDSNVSAATSEDIDSTNMSKKQKLCPDLGGGKEKESARVGNSSGPSSAVVEHKTGGAESKGSESDLDRELFGNEVGEFHNNEEQKKEKPQQQSQQDGETSEAKSGKEENPLESAVKKEELKKIIDEVNDLNKTKSQMIWLLKQVITAEKKRSDTMTKKLDPDPGQSANKR